MFNHFLITRFNLKRSDWKTNKNNEEVLTDEWHKNRFNLFTNFCFPSVASQTNKNFEWLVFFDSSTTKVYRDLIKTLEVKLPNFKPFFIDGMDQFLPSLKSYISKFNEDFIITSGLDNDDCISKNYIKEVQANFNKQDFLALDFVDGYTLQISPNGKLGKKLHQYNPFISLIEKNTNAQTVCNVSHRLWKKEKRILQIKNKRVWSSVIHQENKVNEFTGFGNVNETDFFENFIISDEKRSFLQKNIIPQKKWIISSTINNCSSHWNIIFKNFKKKLGFYN
tara:strand:- start:2089 stop:2928 length:840 start_codon:yes stop_codon:yes gene_type:complete